MLRRDKLRVPNVHRPKRTPLVASAESGRIRRHREAQQRLEPRRNAQRVQEVRLRHRAVASSTRAALRDRLPGPRQRVEGISSPYLSAEAGCECIRRRRTEHE